MLVSKTVKFDAAHFLPNYGGKCRNLHGHTWKVEVAVEGTPNRETGMVVDFAWLKKVLTAEVVERFDHTCLNDWYGNPTAEMLAQWVFDIIKCNWIQSPGEAIQLKWVKVWESEDSYVLEDGK